MDKQIFYQSNGIPVDSIEKIKSSFYIQENIGESIFNSRFFYTGDSIDYKLDDICVNLYDVFAQKVFKSVEDYYKYIEHLPVYITKAGLDSDCNLSKEEFQRLLNGNFVGDNRNSFLYLCDCQALVNSVQELLQTCRSNFVFFYKLLCEMDGLTNFTEDYYAISAEGRIVISTASNLFISLYSIFDILTKLAFELENINNCDMEYPKLASSKKLYGDRKKLKSFNFTGTVFEKNNIISIVENLRNELIHNAAWEMNTKVFFHVENGIVVDKTIYFPDFSEDGHLITYVNRKRFFSRGTKLNDVLPVIYFETLQRIKTTLEKLTQE